MVFKLWFLLLVSFPLLALGDIFYISQQTLKPGDPLLIRRVAMYTPKDAPSGHAESFVKVKLTVSSPDDNPVSGKVEVLVVEGNSLDMIVGCGSDGYIDTLRPVFRIHRELDNEHEATFEGRYVVNSTGNHWLIVSSCDELLGEVLFKGVSVWMNPYGHLPGRLYPLLPFYEGMTILFFAVGIVWFALNAAHWNEVVQLQNYISFLLALCMVEMAAWFFDYRNFNMTGNRHVGGIVVAMLISVLRRSISRMLVVAVCLGYGVVRPTLGSDGWILLGLGTIYMIFESALELAMRYGQTNESWQVWRVVLSLPPAALNAIFYWWIFLALAKLTEQLRARRQDEKLGLYIQFTRVLGLSLVLAVAFALYQMHYISSGKELTEWKMSWLLEGGITEMLYTIILLTILFLWRPSNNNMRFAYAQIGQNDKEVDTFASQDATPALPTDLETAAIDLANATKPRFTISEGEGEGEGEGDADLTNDSETGSDTKPASPFQKLSVVLGTDVLSGNAPLGGTQKLD